MDILSEDLSLADLVGQDQHRKEDALRVLPDADLLFAVLIINSSPIYPGQDTANAAKDLALLVINAKSYLGASQITQAALEVVEPRYVFAAVCDVSGFSQESHPTTDDMAKHIANLPNGASIVDALVAAEAKRVSLVKSIQPSMGLLISLIKESRDLSMLSHLASLVSAPVSLAALNRLVDLKATSHLDDLLNAKSVFFHHDSTARLVIRNVSKTAAASMAADPNCSFIYRDEAMRQLDSATVKEILETSSHLNVQESASLVLSERV